MLINCVLNVENIRKKNEKKQHNIEKIIKTVTLLEMYGGTLQILSRLHCYEKS